MMPVHREPQAGTGVLMANTVHPVHRYFWLCIAVVDLMAAL
jgi:hypothetical protein